MKEIHDFIVVGCEHYGERFVSIMLQHEGEMLNALPGQFVEVRVEDEPNVMLRRPFAINDVDPEGRCLRLLIQIVGKGTRRLSRLAVGDRMNLIYPLGRGFTLEGCQHPLLVGGGAGIAPLFFLAKVLQSRGLTPTVLLGGRTADLIPEREAFGACSNLHIATDDGSLGFKGLVTDHPVLSANYDRIYACGPTPMMQAMARKAAQRDIDCEVSLENMMACGLGACLCCVADTDQGHKCVCKEGPVFNISTMKKWYEQC